jgi:hypothetical protein
MSKLDIMKLNAEAANCRRIAEKNAGWNETVRQALLDKAAELEKEANLLMLSDLFQIL